MSQSDLDIKTQSGVFGLILDAVAGRFDSEKAFAILGDPVLHSLDDVARAFGISPNTVKQSWRSAGMPGRPGAWPLGQILAWKAAAEKALREKRRPTGSAESRQAEADARKTELHVEKLELELSERMGILIDREVAGTAIRTVLSRLSETLSTIGDEMETEFPLDIAKEKVETINRKIRRALTVAAEEGARAIPKARKPEAE